LKLDISQSCNLADHWVLDGVNLERHFGEERAAPAIDRKLQARVRGVDLVAAVEVIELVP
jgi:hypothetical protein